MQHVGGVASRSEARSPEQDARSRFGVGQAVANSSVYFHLLPSGARNLVTPVWAVCGGRLTEIISTSLSALDSARQAYGSC